jgi:predicted benzoate:H+ symporter BenE
MKNRNTAMIITGITALCCGCPGLFSVCWGALAAAISFVPGAEIDMFGSSDPQAALFTGIGSLCFGIIFVAIPIIVGFVTLRKKPEDALATPVAGDQP